METQNLWPAEFAVEKVRSPKTILKEQAGYLMEMTRNVLSADVHTSNYKDTRIHSFVVVAPALNNYRYTLFSVSHGGLFYPSTIKFSEDVDFNDPGKESLYNGYDCIVDSEDELVTEMKKIFNTSHTVRIISSLISQSEAE
jgi:hypothetical protein